ncbi:MAG: carbohydrate-binding family 9-like protein [Myxococcota bacterium]
MVEGVRLQGPGRNFRISLRFEGEAEAALQEGTVELFLHDTLGVRAVGVQPLATEVRFTFQLTESPTDALLELSDPSGRAFAVEAPPAERRGATRWRVVVLEDDLLRRSLPVLEVVTATSSIRVNGKLDESVWTRARAARLFTSLRGEVPSDRATRVRAAYDHRALYLAFECDDPDIRNRYRGRDRPIYRVEAVEAFLMPGRRGHAIGPYFELQASPAGALFDAAFSGARRGMNLRFDADVQVGTTVDGSLNDQKPDSKWVSEWAIQWSSLVPGELPRSGDVWRANFFRIDRSSGLPDAYLAWSPPLVGDFHTVGRFGHLIFGPPFVGKN